jgi:DNA gyrase subunit A
MLISDGGKLIRMPVGGIPTIGRNTQGVRLVRLEETEKVVAMERLAEKEEGEQSEVSPEVAAARAEAESQPLAAEDLGDESGADEDEDGEEDGDDEDEDSDGGNETGGEEKN